MEVFVSNEQTDVELDLTRWQQLAAAVLQAEGVRGQSEMALLFVSRAAIAEMNRVHMGSEYPTDVLAFPIDGEPVPSGRRPDEGGRGPGAEGPSADPPAVLGDVVVCPAVAHRQASERNAPAEDEIALLVVHGVLHLLDYDHQEPEERALMQRREQEVLGRFRALEGSAP